MILSEDQKKAFIVRGPEDFGDNFDDEFKNFRGIAIKGKVKCSNRKVESHFGSPWEKDNNFPSDIYIDMTSTRLSILWLIAGILNILILVIIVALKIKSWNNKYASSSTGVGLAAVMLLSMLVAGILLIYLFMRR